MDMTPILRRSKEAARFVVLTIFSHVLKSTGNIELPDLNLQGPKSKRCGAEKWPTRRCKAYKTLWQRYPLPIVGKLDVYNFLTT